MSVGQGIRQRITKIKVGSTTGVAYSWINGHLGKTVRRVANPPRVQEQMSSPKFMDCFFPRADWLLWGSDQGDY